MHSCPLCPSKAFSCQRSLYAHARDSKRIHHPRCDTCERVFIDKSAQGDHMDAKHQSRCPTCWKCFQFKGAMERHHADKHGRYRCRPCYRRFSTENDRAEHYRTSRAHFKPIHNSITAQTAPQLPAENTVLSDQADGHHATDGLGALSDLSRYEAVEHSDEDRLHRPTPDTLEYAALLPLPPSPVALETKLRMADDTASGLTM